MELDDFFGHKQQNRRFDPDRSYQHNTRQTQHFGQPGQHYSPNFKWEFFLDKLKNNRKLKGFVIVTFLVVLAIVIALIAILLPIILKLLNYISQNGIQGILDQLSGILNKLWTGTGK